MTDESDTEEINISIEAVDQMLAKIPHPYGVEQTYEEYINETISLDTLLREMPPDTKLICFNPTIKKYCCDLRGIRLAMYTYRRCLDLYPICNMHDLQELVVMIVRLKLEKTGTKEQVHKKMDEYAAQSFFNGIDLVLDVPDQMPDQMADQLPDQTDSSLSDQMDDQLFEQIDDQFFAQLDTPMADQLDTPMADQLLDSPDQ